MSNVFVCGCRWGEYAKPYYEIFLEKKIAFAGPYEKFKSYDKKVKEGDYIVIKDGAKALYVGKSVNGVKNLTASSIMDNYEEFEIDDDVPLCVIDIEKWVDIQEYNETVSDPRGAFYQQHQNPDKFIEYYERCQLIIVLKEKLKNSKNLILTGAPGTGKTYLAKNIAASLILDIDVENYKDLSEEDKKIVDNQIYFVQFHPSYDYTDFVEGIRPTKDNSFERKDGIFKAFCKKAIEELYIDSDDEITVSAEMSEYDKTLIKYLKEYIDDIGSYASEETPVEIKGFSGKAILPIIEAHYDDNKIYFTTESNNQKKQQKDVSFEFFIGAYKRFIQNDVEKYKSDQFVNDVKFWWSPSSYYGFMKLFYDRYSDKLQEKPKYVAKNYVFIIDEINRGDLNKILGELFYAIDPGYRGIDGKVSTQYNNLIDNEDPFKDGFYIPKNVYIIGTMNDIDRSVDSLDFAIRRRFAWQEITYNITADNILQNLNDKNLIKQSQVVLENLNIKISELLGDDYNIGASYFLKLNECGSFNNLWDNYLKGVIFEYFRIYPKEERDKYLEELKCIVCNQSSINKKDDEKTN